MDYSKKYVSVKNDRDFRFLFKKGKCIVNNAFVCYIRPSKRRVNRLGLVTSKKIGGAVKRNRARRVLREAFRLFEPEIRQYGDKRYDFIFIARGRTPYMKSNKLYGIMKKLITEQIGRENDKEKGQSTRRL